MQRVWDVDEKYNQIMAAQNIEVSITCYQKLWGKKMFNFIIYNIFLVLTIKKEIDSKALTKSLFVW